MKASLKNRSTMRWAAVLVAVHIALALMSMRGLSLTWDEPSYIGAGYQLFKTGNPQIIPLQLHPPLSYYVNSALLLPLQLDADRFGGDQYIHREYAGLPLIFETDYPPALLMFLSRVPFVLLSALLAILLWQWSRKLYGDSAGLLTLFLYTLSPLVLANCRLATPDIVLALTSTAAFFSFHQYLLQPSKTRGGVTGILLGLALLSKFTALLLIPAFIFVAVVYRVRHDESERKNKPIDALSGVALICCIAFIVVWAGYGFQFAVPFVPEWLEPEADRLMEEKPFWRMVGLLQARDIAIPAYSYLLGIYTQLAAAKGWENNFLFGHVSRSGWWYFYWVAFFLKNTIPFLVFLAAGLLTRQRPSPRPAAERLLLYLIVPMVIFFSLPTKINIGVRYLLPLLPLLTIIAGKAILAFGFGPSNESQNDSSTETAPQTTSAVHRFGGGRGAAFAALCVWQIAAIAWIHPNYLAYFNEFAGGPSHGYKFLVDSNLDWGQDLGRLADYLKENNVADARIRYFGPPGVLKYYGLEWVDPNECGPAPGTWAVSATYLQGLYLNDNDCYRWLRKMQPEHIIGYSIFIYNVTDEDLSDIG
ncbi:MAG: phospholipid carrier-dependent glycosyltransferase [Candidatus Abyssobacteria bacterium SURF_5]|uniref:Phospholipid carrier-dependent glycosyltransferase n=1 Tax=Abyssobacteria bacterium (strain SURF_5) TaxID=2093360 RepID=A0A3A4NEK1_ABYX5|nr:MAG: phospholipid carrier-dependent glycosyltransferase [Candidatus Abyssubacteria bacterium SURF_5]